MIGGSAPAVARTGMNGGLRRACGVAFAILMCGVAVLHAYWALGGTWGIYVASDGELGADAPISAWMRLGTWGLVLALLAAAVLVLMRVGIARAVLPSRLIGLGCWVVALVMLGVTVGNFVGSDLWGRLVIGPLCLLLFILALLVALPGGCVGSMRGGCIMRAVRSVQGWAYAAGAITVALGVAHDAVLSTQLDSVASLTQGDQDGFAWLFLSTGTAVAFAGVLCLVSAHGLARGEAGARRITLAACIFLVLLGAGGVVLQQMGALSLVALAALSFVPWWRTRRAAVSGGVG